MDKKKSKLEQIVWDIYVDMYANSEPSADFKELVEEAEINEDGRKVIKYNDYIIDQKIADEIIDKHIKSNKLKDYEKKQVKVSIHLGVSPKFNY